MKKILHLLLILIFLFFINGCDSWDSLVDSLGGTDDDTTTSIDDKDKDEDKDDDKEEDEEEEEENNEDDEDDEDEPKESDKFHHYNPKAWDGVGSALVMCKGDKRMDSCEIEGRTMQRHGSQDKGRDVWTVYKKAGLKGTIVCERGDDSFAFEVSGWTNGDCD